jgi:CspA family cold shock protein
VIFLVAIANGRHMSRYKDYRGPKRCDYNEDYIPDYQGAGRQPEYFSPTQGSEPVEATVKWFNADKGFGFVIMTGGPDAFLSARALNWRAIAACLTGLT